MSRAKKRTPINFNQPKSEPGTKTITKSEFQTKTINSSNQTANKALSQIISVISQGKPKRNPGIGYANFARPTKDHKFASNGNEISGEGNPGIGADHDTSQITAGQMDRSCLEIIPKGTNRPISEVQKKSGNSKQCESVNFLKIYLGLQSGTVVGSPQTSAKDIIPQLQLKGQALLDIHQTRLTFLEDVF
jgi:hypothetical protein